MARCCNNWSAARQWITGGAGEREEWVGRCGSDRRGTTHDAGCGAAWSGAWPQPFLPSINRPAWR